MNDDSSLQESRPPDRDPAEAGADAVRRRRRRTALAVLGVIGGLLAVLFLYEDLTWPDVGALRTEDPRTTAFIERWKERAGGKEPTPEWRPVPYSRISPWLAKAVLVSEDIEFFQHGGFSRSEIRAAIEKAWEEKEPPRGASTLTQQLAKNLWLSPSRNPLRKAKEAVLTLQLEHELGKRRILELYLNVVEFGPGIYGAEAAARHYFGIPAAELGPRQAAELAAGLPMPSRWHPGSASAVYARRVERTLERMEKAEFLNRYVGLRGAAAGVPVDSSSVPDSLVPVEGTELVPAPLPVQPAPVSDTTGAAGL